MGLPIDLEVLVLRQAVTSWRDDAVLEAAEILNRCAMESLDAFEESVQAAGPLDMIWAPETFASDAIDREMSARCAGPLRKSLADSARQLSAITPRYSALGTALTDSVAELELPSPPEPEPKPAPKDDGRSPENPPLTAVPQSWPEKLRNQAEVIRRQTGVAFSEATDSAARMLRDHTIVHNRLRSAARAHIGSRWMGYAGDPRPILAQIILMIDETAAQARMLP